MCSDGGIYHRKITFGSFYFWRLKKLVQLCPQDLGIFTDLDTGDIMVFHIMVELVPCQIESLHRFGNSVVFWFFGSYETFGNVHMLLGVVHHDADFLFGNGIL